MKSLVKKWFGIEKDSELINYDLLFSDNTDVTNVLIFTENLSPTYYICFDIPLRRLYESGKVNVAVVSQDTVSNAGYGSWSYCYESFHPNVVIMTRYGQPFGKDILEFFQLKDVPVIYHIDDDLLELPESLGAEICKRHGAKEVIEARKYLLKNSNLIYASTYYLADVLQKRFPNQILFYGMHSPYMGEELNLVGIHKRNHPVIGYMGSKGHQQDIELIVPSLVQLLDERPALHFEVFGTIKMPAQMERFGHRVKRYPPEKNYRKFLVKLTELSWDIGLAPLVNAPFNMSKSATKFIEYTAASVPIIASEVDVYRNIIPEGGGLLVKDDWYNSITTFLDDPQSAQSSLAKSRDHCANNYTVSLLGEQLLNIFTMVNNKMQL